MSPNEPRAQKPSTATGLLSQLRACLHFPGAAVPSARLRRRGLLLVPAALAAILGLAILATPALACEGPQFQSKLSHEEVFATRANIEVQVLNTNIKPAPEAKWSGEYATSEALLDEGKGTAAGSGTLASQFLTLALGALDATGGVAHPVLHHLQPATLYFARFHVETECGKDEKTFEFTTTAIAKPEIPKGFSGGPTTFEIKSLTPTSAGFTAQVETNGAETTYHFEYSLPEAGHAPAQNSPSWQPFNAGEASGTVTKAEDFANPKARLTGLSPETTYYVRVEASNEKGEVVQSKYSGVSGSDEVESFTTPTAKPVVGGEGPSIRNVTGTSAHLTDSVNPNDSETQWRFESAASASGPWTPVPGAAGTISQAEAEALFPAGRVLPEAKLTGLAPATVYYVRLFAQNAAGEGEVCYFPNNQTVCEPIATTSHGIASFETSGPPIASAFATHALHGESLRLLGSVDPHSLPTSEEQRIAIGGAPSGGSFTLKFKGEETAPIAYNASSGAVEKALSALPGKPSVDVRGPQGGPYNLYFGGNVNPLAEKDQPQIEANASGLTPSGTVTVTTTQQGGEAYDTHYHFEYIAEKSFKADGNAFGAGTQSSPTLDLGAGDAPKFVGYDLPALSAGETYRYRISAVNTSPGEPVIHGVAQALTVPVPPQVSPQAPCPNQALRTGPSANLPDCRAYEQITPVDKEGAQEVFRYEGLAVPASAFAGEDGEHLMLKAPAVHWGSGPGDGQSPYFFAREAGGWKLTSAAPQPETGVNTVIPQTLAPDLTGLGFESRFATSPTSESNEVEYKAGPPGGPYATVAKVPREQIGSGGGWVGASEDFSKLILSSEDRKLVKPQTTTLSGSDLYEYAEGKLSQVNVGIGSCGARIAKGHEETGRGPGPGGSLSPHAVSADGRRVFFEAVPGADCSQPSHLYVRVNGAETLDLGAYRFAAADAAGSEALLEREGGANPGLYLYRAGSGAPKYLASTAPLAGTAFIVSADLSTIYFSSRAQLSAEAPAPSPELGAASNMENTYRYDVGAEALAFVAQVENEQLITHLSAGGRYYYFQTRRVGSVPGGSLAPGGGEEYKHTYSGTESHTRQIYRYDSAEGTIQCVSCASAFNPEPRLGSVFGQGTNGQAAAPTGTPRLTLASADGRFAFFQTPAALVPADVDGEVVPEGTIGLGLAQPSADNSLSGDVYEWRADGVDGCAAIQGCLALITSGRGGYLNLLLGSAEEGRDVFIYTSSQLLPRDNDSAGDIYDVRIGGGFPEPTHPVECEGDACSHPVPAPNDPTPSSETYNGSGNVHETPKPKKHRKKHRKAKHHKRAVNRNRGGSK